MGADYSPINRCDPVFTSSSMGERTRWRSSGSEKSSQHEIDASKNCKICSKTSSRRLNAAIHKAQRELDDFQRQVERKCQKKRFDQEI
jgi:hypothetical protein